MLGDPAHPEHSGEALDEQEKVASVEVPQASPQNLARVQEVLQCIFEFYACQGTTALQEPRLTNTRFTRMAMDAALLDERLTPAKVDVTFSRVCGSSPHMLLTQFRDAMVRLAAIKYPSLPRTEAVMQLYQKHLATFQGTTKGVVAELDQAMLSLLGAARPALLVLYEGYFGAMGRQAVATGGTKGRTQKDARASLKQSSLAQSEAQNALAQCLSDFEVVPELVPKAAAFSVFREVAKTAIVPREVQMKVAPDEAGESGRFFTYSHFACSLAVTAQRAFASAGASSLVRLMQWMDASKGRVLFSQNFPGTAPKGCAISLKVLPEMERLPEDVQRDLGAVTLKQATGQEPAQSRQEGPAPAEEVGRPRRSRSVTSLTREPRAAAAPLPEWARLEIQKTFGHYASLGDPLNRSTLTSQKFGRFLRDCGLLAIEADGPVSFDFAPEGRRASVRRPSKKGQESATGRQGLARSNSAGALRRSSFGGRTGPRGSIGPGEGAASCLRRASFAVSSAQAAQANVQLPLRVFPVPPLTQVEVDLIFVQATRPVDTPERRKSMVQAGGGSKRLMTVDSFTKALSDVAAQCMAPEDVSGGLENFCRRVIVPLNGVLLRSRSEELVSALDLLDKPEVKRLMTDCSTGLNKLFSCYATEPTARRPHWNSDSVTRFAIDFDFLAEVSNLPLQRMFQDACQHTGNFRAAEEKMLVEGFPLFLLMLAKKTHTSQVCNAPEERVPILFQRINAIACTATQAPRFGLAKEQLLPLSREMPGPRRSFSATPGRSDRLEGSRRAEESGLSWDELLGPESFESF